MLSGCGEREDGFNTNRHSQRGRWERGKNQKKNLETTAKAIDTSLLEAIDSGVIGANGSNLVTNGFLSITGTGVDFRLHYALNNSIRTISV